LAIAAMTLVLWFRSKRKAAVGIALGVLAALLVAFMPSSWEERMSTIKTYQEDNSAMSRINAWETAVNIANDRVFGAGFAADSIAVFRQYSKLGEMWVFTAHSIYFQAIGEQGWIGFALFLSVGACTFWSSIWVRRHAKRRPETMWAFEFAGMVQVSMVGYAVGGSFLSLTYLDLPYNIAVAMIACKWWLKHEQWKMEPHGFMGSGAPVARLRPPVPKEQRA
jgi:putative inorganic carbon (hco3(-)) transporter